MEKYELIDKELADPDLPKDRVQALGPTRVYKIVDMVENVPKGFWGSNVESNYEMTDVERGIFCRVHCPMSISMDALWEIREAEDGEGLEMVEENDITCSRPLASLVKGQCESGGKCIDLFRPGVVTLLILN